MEAKLPNIPPLKTPKQTIEFVKHIEIISLLSGLKMSKPKEFKHILNIYRIGLN